jgi:hypothetical protein
VGLSNIKKDKKSFDLIGWYRKDVEPPDQPEDAQREAGSELGGR